MLLLVIVHFLCVGTLSIILSAPSFVPRNHGVVSPLPKNVVASQVYNRAQSNKANQITMMPIGVPKVAYRTPGSQQADWYVLFLFFLLAGRPYLEKCGLSYFSTT